jgi:hypothetical protein
MASATLTPATVSSTDRTPTLSRARVAIVRWIGIVGIIGGVVMIAAGGTVWGMVSSQLADQKITVAEDAPFLAGATVDGPFTAYAQATIINTHALKISGGKTYAELEQDDPLRPTVMNASFLRASLFTSVVSFGVAAFAMGLGLLTALFGFALTRLAPAVRHHDA